MLVEVVVDLALQTYQYLKEANMIHHTQYKKSKQFKNIFQISKMVFTI